ncbi:MAG: hypothetical protein NVS2B9_04530 [Myxococcales bacterium]
MVTALALGGALKGLGVLAAALAAGGALLLSDPRARAGAALAALVLTPALALAALWHTHQVTNLRAHLALALVAGAVALALMVALATLIGRHPGLVAPLAVAALPFRIPLQGGTDAANLLLPLYLVVGAGVLAYAWDRLRPRSASQVSAANGSHDPAAAWIERRPARLELALVAAVALYSLQAIYSTDLEQALKNVAFFYVPFILLFKLLTSVSWTRRLIVGCFGVALGLGLLFAGVGFAEFATRHLLWNQKVIQSNEFESYFRVNSLFFDPNIYGRFLVMVMTGLAATLLWPARGRQVLLVTISLAVLWGGLLLSFSVSSFAALLVGLAVLAGCRWNPRPVLFGAAVVAVAGLVVVAIAPGVIHLKLSSSHSVNNASSGRFNLVRGGLSMFSARPIWGFGSGSFAERYRAREQTGTRAAASASHTIPLTVAAEQGAVGIAAYLFVMVAALAIVLRGLGALRGRAPPGAPALARAYVAAALCALIFHTMLYAAFLEDPLTWTLLALAVVLGRADPVRRVGIAAAVPFPLRSFSDRLRRPRTLRADPPRTGRPASND